MTIFDWCLKQKDGLKKTKPTVKLCNEFLEKSRNDLIAADLMMQNRQFEWFIIVNYYAMYHAASALLALIGFESRNHTCTRIALEEIFVKHNKKVTQELEWLNASFSLQEDLLKALSQAKKLREEVQYEIVDILPQLAKNEHEIATQFIQEINKLINKIKKQT